MPSPPTHGLLPVLPPKILTLNMATAMFPKTLKTFIIRRELFQKRKLQIKHQQRKLLGVAVKIQLTKENSSLVNY
jgi:hypothetical protein